MTKRTVDDICRDIRNLVNTSAFIDNIEKEGFNWDLTWAAMDMIEDTELAINSFAQSGKDASQGSDYLLVYGLFQAIFMQQDAVQNFAEGLNLLPVDISTDPKAKEVREMRNKYFGHHKYTRKGVTTYHGISRMTVGSGSITAWTWPKFSTETINLNGAIATNRKYIEKTLKKVLADTRKKEADLTPDVD